MPGSVTCNSCGHNVQLPDDFQRRKVRCPECGVYCEVATPSQQRKAPKEPAKQEIPSDAAPPRAAFPEPPAIEETARVSAPAEPAMEKPRKKSRVLHCTFCGELVRAKADKCPNCGSKIVRPPPLPKPVAAAPRPKKIIKPPAPVQTSDDEEDSLPYSVDIGPQEIICANCQKRLPADAVLCVHCGSNLESGEKVERVYEKIDRQWESNMSLSRRKTIYIVTQAIVFPLMLVLALRRGEPFSFIVPWLFGSALLAFLLGTYDRIDLKRNKRGQVQLSKTWRLCFRERQTMKIVPWEYEGIKIMRNYKFQLMDFLLFLMLLVMGVIPGILWWMWVMNKATYYVALTQRHGFPELSLYHGSSETQMDEIAQILINATGLPCERS